MNITAQKKKTNQKVKIIAGLVFLIFLFWGYIDQINHPWTCKQAREAWQKNKFQYNAEYGRQLDKVNVNRDTIDACI